MSPISRRDLLASAVAASASSLVGRSAWAQSAASLGANATASAAGNLPSVAPREQLLFDFGWKFTFGNGSDSSKDLNLSLIHI